jgi:hypothetical protein
VSAPGKRCRVDGCNRTSRVDVGLTDSDVGEVLAGSVEQDELSVCMEHAEKLGRVRGLYSDAPWLVVDPERAVGWRITIDVRPSGRWVVFLVEPS